MKNLFVIPGAAPEWVEDQIRYTADHLAEFGDVTVAFTALAGREAEQPGMNGRSTLLSIAPSGRPIPRARLMTALGFRSRRDNNIVTLFDEGNTALGLWVALVGRLRREHVIVHDLRSAASDGGVVDRLVDRLAHRVIKAKPAELPGERSVVLVACNGDLDFATLILRSIASMSREAVSYWRFVLQTSDARIERLVAESPRPDLVSLESGRIADELLEACDVVVARHGVDDRYATRSVELGAAGIVVGSGIAERISQRLDGVWLARSDASSIVVALESARSGVEGRGRWALEIRATGDEVVDAVRATAAWPAAAA